jgi:hypothetical protein
MTKETQDMITKNIELPIVELSLKSFFFNYNDTFYLQVMKNDNYYHFYILDINSVIAKIEYVEEIDFNSFYDICYTILETKYNSIMNKN